MPGANPLWAACLAHLDWRARNGTVAAKDAAIAGFGFESCLAARTIIKEKAGVGRHGLGAAMAARRAGDDRMKQWLRCGARSTAKPIPDAGSDKPEESGIKQIDTPGIIECVSQG